MKKIDAPIAMRVVEFLRDFPEVHLRDQIAQINKSRKIPNIVYQTWENKTFGRTHFLSIKSFRNRNRDYSFRLFDASERDAYVLSNWQNSPLSEMYERARFGQIKADLFRYMIVFDLGGFYFDISKAIATPLRVLSGPEADGVISYEKNYKSSRSLDCSNLAYPSNLVLQWGFGFSKGHDCLSALLSMIEEKYRTYENKIQENPKNAILNLTGPNVFTMAVESFFSSNPHNFVHQAGIDFNNSSILNLPGSAARHKKIRPYALVRGEKLFR